MPALEQTNVTSILPDNSKLLVKRKRLFKLLGLIVAVASTLFYLYWIVIASKHVTTNNAYSDAEIAQVTAATTGIVQSIKVVDTQAVKAGDILVTLDDADAVLNLKEAEANVARTSSDLTRSKAAYERRQKLAGSGYVSPEELSSANSALISAQASVDAAKAALDKAQINLNRVVIRAPVDGIVAKRQVQLGQSINAGNYLLSVIPTRNIVVNANFKEVQLGKVRIGQSVELHADIYGSSVTYHGRVVGVAGGTGASFAVIPAQNATGNWIKVVQRIPVRIVIDTADLAKYPLQVGLSMNVDIYTGKQSA
jgi:membrane fusion protein (multidrug efflux system)